MIRLGDCREVMAGMDADSVDSIVTDPPYGLSFMGKGWDHAVPGVEFWTEALRVAKPGAHLVAFGGTRTFHRLTCAIEDAGWEIRDCLSWLYGSGFPKSLDVSKAMDKAAGAEREVIGKTGRCVGPSQGRGSFGGQDAFRETGWEKSNNLTAPATDLARQWQGWGTALKPAWEPIILARKPLVGTVAANVTTHGTGGLNVDGCRVGTTEVRPKDRTRNQYVDFGTFKERGGHPRSSGGGANHPSGRWPANVVLDGAAGAMLDEQSGELRPATSRTRRGKIGGTPRFLERTGDLERCDVFPDTGGASRFFYSAKASRAERGEGNVHPTVKPIALMRWLCRLVTPPGGLILDPFTGSGTTGCAAVAEGFRFVGAELNPEYAEIARRRIAASVPNPTLGLEAA